MVQKKKNKNAKTAQVILKLSGRVISPPPPKGPFFWGGGMFF